MSTIVEDGQRTDGYIRTFSGMKVFLLEPSLESINIIDMAHSLAHICRFTGHPKKFYSVGQHSVYVSWICPPEQALWGLIHEGGEPFFSDLNSVAKRLPGMDAYRTYEINFRTKTAVKFGLSPDEPPSVKEADNLMLVTEQRDLMWGDERSSTLVPLALKIKPWSSRKSKRVFLLRFKELTSTLPLYQRWYMRWVRGAW